MKRLHLVIFSRNIGSNENYCGNKIIKCFNKFAGNTTSAFGTVKYTIDNIVYFCYIVLLRFASLLHVACYIQKQLNCLKQKI